MLQADDASVLTHTEVTKDNVKPLVSPFMWEIDLSSNQVPCIFIERLALTFKSVIADATGMHGSNQHAEATGACVAVCQHQLAYIRTVAAVMNRKLASLSCFNGDSIKQNTNQVICLSRVTKGISFSQTTAYGNHCMRAKLWSSVCPFSSTYSEVELFKMYTFA